MATNLPAEAGQQDGHNQASFTQASSVTSLPNSIEGNVIMSTINQVQVANCDIDSSANEIANGDRNKTFDGNTNNNMNLSKDDIILATLKNISTKLVTIEQAAVQDRNMVSCLVSRLDNQDATISTLQEGKHNRSRSTSVKKGANAGQNKKTNINSSTSVTAMDTPGSLFSSNTPIITDSNAQGSSDEINFENGGDNMHNITASNSGQRGKTRGQDAIL